MGGDLGPRAAFCACEIALSANPALSILLSATDTALAQLPGSLKHHSRLELLVAREAFGPELKPTEILRHKQSSLWLAVQSVAEARVAACVSAGNTGALMVAGKKLLGMLPGIERPAICQRWPTYKGHTLVLDMGANVEVTARQIGQFARMGSVMSPVAQARVALLNIGTEINKGGELIRARAEQLRQLPFINYVGFIEPDQIVSGDVEVVVTDGFTGNVALKASEGAARFLTDQLRAAFGASWYGRIVGQLAKPVLLKWRTRFDPDRYNGASFLGLAGQLVKSHGSADAKAFAHAIAVAAEQADSGLAAALAAHFSSQQDA